MKFTRRRFIQSSAVAALAATLGHAAGRDSGFLAVSSTSEQDTVGYLMREHFEPFINTNLRITNDEGRTAVVSLRKADDLKEQINLKRGYTGECFRLGFEASRKTKLTQGIYHFDHEALGRFSLFLTPIGGSGIHYEAIINRAC